MYKKIVLAACATFAGFGASAAALPPIEAYGNLPSIRNMALSPDGTKAAFISERDGKEALLVVELGVGQIYGLNTEKLNVRAIDFATNKHVILKASRAARVQGYKGRFDYSGAFSINIENEKYVQLFNKTESLHPAQSGLGRIVGHVPGEDKVYMPAFEGAGNSATYSLYKVDLDSGRGKSLKRGFSYSADWFIGPDGEVLAREDHDDKRENYSIVKFTKDKQKKIFEDTDAELMPFNLLGTKADGSALIISGENANGYRSLYELNYEGEQSDEIFIGEKMDVDRVILDENRVVFGVEYSGLFPSYEFYDERLTNAMLTLAATFPQSSVHLTDWSDGFETLLIYVEGGNTSGRYYAFNTATSAIRGLTSARPEIKPEHVAASTTIEYKARDGLRIPAIITWPLGASASDTKNAPTIIMPHGGPESYDQIGFDWLAQYFASRGYLVLQPNFRGSAGFGYEFKYAGRGEWGKKMQDDVTDGLKALIKTGMTDPERVCIVGASYGGYSALAGGAFTPDLYKCVAAIAPVSDLPKMLDEERRDRGSDSWVYSYWQKVIGDRKEDAAALKSVSPARFAQNFQAPVLLIHGKDDFVVPMAQSLNMKKALEREGKQVEFLRLKGEDHYLSSSETRLETLKALDSFVARHIGR